MWRLFLHRRVEQLVARKPHNLQVAGSSPVPATTFFPVGNGFLRGQRKSCLLFLCKRISELRIFLYLLLPERRD